MPDIQPNHVDTIRALESEVRAIRLEADTKIGNIEDTIKILRKANKACLKCGGAGGSKYRIVAEADSEWHRCTACEGTGRQPGKGV